MTEQKNLENKFKFVKVDDSISEKIAAPEYSYWKLSLIHI